MRKNYCIGSLRDLKGISELDLAQITLNSHTYPARRRTVEALNAIQTSGCTTDLIIHLDFVYIASRYCMFREDVRRDILHEIVDICKYASVDSHIKGLVWHTDYPIAKVCINSDVARMHYKAAIWDTQFICDSFSRDLLAESVDLFYHDFSAALPSPAIKVYLENTTKIGPHGEGTVEYLSNLFVTHPEYSSHLGLCVDLEHDAAVTGEYLRPGALELLQDRADLIVHLNCIPDDAPMGSRKDRHSDTTIFECTVNRPDYYLYYVESLDYLNIPWVREVKSECAKREIKQLQDYAAKI